MYKAVVKNWSRLAALAGIAVLACSCATHQQALGPKFRDASAADVVIRYSSDSTIFMWKPDGREGPFYRIFNRQEICDEIARREGTRNLAVVVLNYHRFRELEHQVKQAWVDDLSRLQFSRVIFVRANDTDQVNGMRIVEDRFLTLGAPAHSLSVARTATLSAAR